MRKFSLYILFTFLCSGIMFFAGCMDDKDVRVTGADGVTLNARHTGWGSTAGCDTCHSKMTFLYTLSNGIAVHEMLEFADGQVYFGGCISCHGANGVPLEDSNRQLSNCTICHSSNVDFIPLNKRYAKTHTKKEDITGESCVSCHIVGNHPTKSTSIIVMPDEYCLKCHVDHGDGLDCSRCHDQEGGRFYRDKDGNINGHAASYIN